MRVRGEDVAGPRGLDGLVEGHVRRAAELADAFQGHERGVSLVHVADRRLDAHRHQGLEAADAQQDLLADPQLAVAAVETAGDHAVAGRVGRRCSCRAGTA